jgi:hypothetical protein
MEPLDVLMPTKEGRFIPQSVLEGLLGQQLPFRLWVSTTVSDGDYAKARNHIKQRAHSHPYVLMLDNDVVLPEGALGAMMRFLDTQADFVAIALQKGHLESGGLSNSLQADEPMHVDMSCVLFRTEDLLRLTFRYPGDQRERRQGCECLQACQEIRGRGKRIGFLKGITAQHLDYTETWSGLA